LYDAPENATDPDEQYSMEETKKYSNKFRQSAFTVSWKMFDIARLYWQITKNQLWTVEELNSDRRPHPHGESPYWTILLLSPSGFFVTPLMNNDLAQPSDWRDIGSQPNALHAELACIIRALREVITRWTQLYEYIMVLLYDSDIMDPKAYLESLFDNAAMTGQGDSSGSLAASTNSTAASGTTFYKWSYSERPVCRPSSNAPMK
jgi:hypothetical protein